MFTDTSQQKAKIFTHYSQKIYFADIFSKPVEAQFRKYKLSAGIAVLQNPCYNDDSRLQTMKIRGGIYGKQKKRQTNQPYC